MYGDDITCANGSDGTYSAWKVGKEVGTNNIVACYFNDGSGLSKSKSKGSKQGVKTLQLTYGLPAATSPQCYADPESTSPAPGIT